jgi:hypothetical protein
MASDSAAKTRGMTMNRFNREDGVIKYGIAWLLGVPVSLLLIIFLISRGC